MKKLHFLFLSILFLSLLAFLPGTKHSAAVQEWSSTQEEYVPNEVLVKFKKDIPRTLIQQDIDLVQGKIVTYLGREITTLEWGPEISTLRSFLADPDLFQIRVPYYIGTEQAIYLLSMNPNVKYAEKNFIGHALVIPDDTHFSKLWGLHNTGQTEGTSDADIDAPEAWNIFTDSSNIVVAVIDTGINYNHEDLQTNIWTNPGETGGGKETDGIDNDSNGYIDDWRGWNFTSYPGTNNPMDDYYPVFHGTHVAGTIGARGDNNKGVAGVCWKVKLMALKWLNSLGYGDTANAVRAIDYSTYNGAHLSNNSWGVPDSSSLFAAINRARTNGKLFMAAAGNTPSGGTNNDWNPIYPASYDLDNIISVLASDHNDNKAGYSHYGLYSVDLGSPGGTDGSQSDYNIYSTSSGNYYRYLCGTSMAAPHVAGVAALVLGDRPNLDWWQVKTIIMDSIDLKSSLSGKVRSGGRLNVYNALTESTPDLPAAPSNLRAEGYCFKIKLTWQDNSNNEQGFKIYRKSGNFFYYFRSVGANVTTYWDMELPPSQLFNYRVRAYNQDGTSPWSNADGDRTLPMRQCDEWQ